MKMLKDKKVLLVLGVALLVIIGGVFFIMNKKAANTQPADSQQEQVVEKLDPAEIGLSITAKPDKKAVKFAVAKPAGIKSIEYQLTYEADSTAQEKSEGGEARVQRGITGEETLTSGDSYESPWLDLGSCSKNICRYDSGVTSVSLTLKVVKADGKVFEVDKTLDL